MSISILDHFAKLREIRALAASAGQQGIITQQWLAALLEELDMLLADAPPLETEIPNVPMIVQFLHCANCITERPRGQTPRGWVQMEAGWTEKGLQLVCLRCKMNIVHIDFENCNHPANWTTPKGMGSA